MTLDALLARLDGVKPTGQGYMARCPAHPDDTQSLAVRVSDDAKILTHCFAGCSTAAVLDALGLTMKDLFPETDPPPQKTVVATYRYHDQDGRHLYDVLRYHPKDFKQRRADGVWSMKGVRRVLYRLPDIQGAMTVYIPEGEKDVEALRALGLTATTNPGGADPKRWQPAYTAQLTTAAVERVVILPDNDDRGRAHAETVARSCHDAGLHVQVLALPGLPVKGDVSDWLAAGHTKADLAALVQTAPAYVPTDQTADARDPSSARCAAATRARTRRTGHRGDEASYEPPALVGFTFDALREHVFPVRRGLLLRGENPVVRDGTLAQVCAPRGVGKTWLLQTLGLVAATGGDALGFRAPERSRVLYVDGEMASDEIKQRFELLADRLNIRSDAHPALTIVGADWQEDFLPRLDTAAGQIALAPFLDAADLIILDNRSCLFDSEGEKDPTAWQPAQALLLSLRRRQKAVLTAHHANRQGGARGISKAEDLLDLHILLARPEDYSQDQGARFLVTFDKTRGFHGSAAAPFVAQLTADGWITQREDGQPQTVAEKLLEYLRLAHRADQRPCSANQAIAGARVNRADGLRAWADLLQRAAIRKHPDGGFYAA